MECQSGVELPGAGVPRSLTWDFSALGGTRTPNLLIRSQMTMLSMPSIAPGMYVTPGIVPSEVSIGSVVPVLRNCGGNCTEAMCRLLRPHREVAAAALGVSIAWLEDDPPLDEAAAIGAVHLHVAHFPVGL